MAIIEIVDNVFVKMFTLAKAGDIHDGHAHTFNHITLLAKGIVKMRMSGFGPDDIAANKGRNAVDLVPSKFYHAPTVILTPKGIVHEFEAVSDDCLLCCIHAIRDGDGIDDIAPHEITAQQARELMQKYPLVQIEGTRNA